MPLLGACSKPSKEVALEKQGPKQYPNDQYAAQANILPQSQHQNRGSLITKPPTNLEVEAALLPVELEDDPLAEGVGLDCTAFEEPVVDSGVPVAGAVAAVAVLAALLPSVVVAGLFTPPLTSPAF